MGWVLEVSRMFVYISFPVGVFYYVNQPEYFDKYVLKIKKDYYPILSKQRLEEMETFIRDVNVRTEKQRLDEMEKKKIRQ